MGPHSCVWVMPNAAWQAVCHHLQLQDILTARLVCRHWRTDLGAFVSVATVIPSQLLVSPQLLTSQHVENSCIAAAAASSCTPASPASPTAHHVLQAVRIADHAHVDEAACARMLDALAGANTSSSNSNANALEARVDCSAVYKVLDAFQHCEVIHIDISTPSEQQLAGVVIDAVATHSFGTALEFPSGSSLLHHCDAVNASQCGSSCSLRGSGMDDSCATDSSYRGVQANSCGRSSSHSSSGSGTNSTRQHSRLKLCLDALQRNYHCHGRQEYPNAPAAAKGVFHVLSHLPRELSPTGLTLIVMLQLDVFPEDSRHWQVLKGMPCLRELVLPFFKPALPHEHLPALAKLTQLRALTVSVQGSITAWRANCAAFASLGQLSNLERLSLHAFHCPGTHLASAVYRLKALSELCLSGRVVLEPLPGLSALTKLAVLELTQDVQYPALCDLVHSLPGTTQLAVGRVTLLPASQAASTAPLAAAAQQQQHNAAGNADHPGPQNAGAVLADAAPAAAEAAAVVVAADDGGAAVAAAAGEGGVGEVMLEDVGAIVDGLIGNLQDGVVPVHLQRIIERFESIIQLDLTRRTATSPWGWPIAGWPLLLELGHKPQRQQQQQQHLQRCEGWASSSSSSAGCSSFEMALLRPADLSRLEELPSQLRHCSHLGLRLRDQLLAFASVCPVRLAPGQLSHLGSAFTNLSSLSLCGKVALDGTALIDLAQGLTPAATTAAASVQQPPAVQLSSTTVLSDMEQLDDVQTSSSSSHSLTTADKHPAVPAIVAAGSTVQAGSALVCLCLDCHFVGVSAAQMTAALANLPKLKVLSLRHRGAGKLPVPLSSLPKSLVTLAAKKVLLYQEKCSAQLSTHQQQLPQQHQQRVLMLPDAVNCHVLNSPGFRQSVSSGLISTAPSVSDLPSLAVACTGTMEDGCSGNSNETAVAESYADAVSMDAATLPNLSSLFLKNCLVGGQTLQVLLGTTAAITSCSGLAVGPSSGSADCNDSSANPCYGSSSDTSGGRLLRLSVTGDNATHGELCDVWPTWVAVIRQLTHLQVLDLAVPDSLGSASHETLLEALVALPRLIHLHLTTSHTPLLLLGLTRLQGLRTLSVNYTGPPALPSQLLGELQAGLGPYCKVQLWETAALQSMGSFFGSNASTAGNGAGRNEGDMGSRGDRKRELLKCFAGGFAWGVMLAVSWRCGRRLGGFVEGRRARQRTAKALKFKRASQHK